MTEWTAADIQNAREEPEDATATLLGRLLFEFARLDTATGLCMVWIGEGKRLEDLTGRAAAYSFHKKLKFISQHLEVALPPGSKPHTGYVQWFRRADAVRVKRNQLVHGRWDVDPYRSQVINVVGVPTSPDQTEYRFTLAELQAVLDELKQLQTELSKLRKQWPL